MLKFVLAAALCFAAASTALAQQGPRVAAASDLKFALDEVLTSYPVAPEQKPRVTYGSSGNFTTQIAQGAPFDLFLSADESYVFQLADKQLTQNRGDIYAIGRIVIFTPKGAPVNPDAELADLQRAAADGRLSKFAIANPEHAPYGRAAKEVLTAKGLWSAVQPKLVFGENVSQAAQFAVSGSTQGGIFAYSLALSPSFANAGNYVLIPDTLHSPLRQRMVLLKNAGPEAKALFAYLQQATARAVFKKYGFVLPGE